jgi:hypothetical protein
MACGYEATSKQDLEEHTDANHIEKLADADVAKERREKKEKTK